MSVMDDERFTIKPPFCHQPVLTWDCPKGQTSEFGPWYVPCRQRAFRWVTCADGTVRTLCRDHAPRRPIPAGR